MKRMRKAVETSTVKEKAQAVTICVNLERDAAKSKIKNIGAQIKVKG